MYLAIVVLLSISQVALTSPLHDLALGSAHKLHKRDWVLECNDEVPIPAEADIVGSLSSICKGYPRGLGLYCDVNGQKLQRTPHSLLSRQHGHRLSDSCMNNCFCHNLAPEVPPRVDEALDANFQQCAMGNDMEGENDENNHAAANPAQGGQSSSVTTCPRSRTSHQGYQDACECDEYWYGRPNNQDCLQAMRQLPDYGVTRHKLREFLAAGTTPQQAGVEPPVVRTPIISTHGQCTIAVFLSEGPRAQDSIVVDTSSMNRAARDLRTKCVQTQGMGGKFYQANSEADENALKMPEIVVLAPDSKWKKFLDLKYHCAVKAEGAAVCKPVPVSKPRTKGGAYGNWRYMGTIGQQGWREVPQGSRQACSGSCYNPKDCDINSGCMCAAPDKGIPISRSWGQHSCMYVAGAAAAVAAAAISPNGCRGRCLLQEDGTIDIGRPTNASNATVLSFDVTNEFANTSWGPPVAWESTTPLAPVTISSPPDNTSTPTSSYSDRTSVPTSFSGARIDEQFPSGPEDSGLSVNGSALGNGTSDPEINGIPTIANDTGNPQYGDTSGSSTDYVVFNDSDDPPILYCPCNCTYVSAACCLSSIVYEDPSLQIPMEPLLANSSVCCDPNSGLFFPKPSGECTRLASNFTDGFIGLGNVKWNQSNSISVGFPDQDDGNQ